MLLFLKPGLGTKEACMHNILKDYSVQHLSDASIMVESILIQVTVQSEDPATKLLVVSWTYQDEEMGSYVTSLLKKALPQVTARDFLGKSDIKEPCKYI
ncbi:integrator complex subunit 11-like isoform X2 [Hemicordylus capensis]|uniref:integrator complex subunit 11-like isoform X2 n=1 Tax=Hemicordylus capensis TaxID=884348 RepID=UPI0023024267|nr:integrator complex subunit 11-like isoform X2 [Hemicordylus capensis]